jgi:hypothetical protein
MDAWTAFGMFKLFLDIISGGPTTIVKGILMAGIPSPWGEMIDAGEVIFALFNLNGTYQGTRVLREDQQVPFSQVQLLNRDELETALARYDFPELARREFARLESQDSSARKAPQVRDRNFATLDGQKPTKREFPKF